MFWEPIIFSLILESVTILTTASGFVSRTDAAPLASPMRDDHVHRGVPPTLTSTTQRSSEKETIKPSRRLSTCTHC